MTTKATEARLDAVRAAAARFIYNSLYRSGTGLTKLEVVEPFIPDAAPETPSRDSEDEMRAALGVGVAMRDALAAADCHVSATKAERATAAMREEIMRGGTIVGRCAEILSGPTQSLSPIERKGRNNEIRRIVSVDSESVLRAEAVAESKRGRGPTQRGPSAPAIIPGTVIEVERPDRVDAQSEIDKAKSETKSAPVHTVNPDEVNGDGPKTKPDESTKPEDPKGKGGKGSKDATKPDDVIDPRG